MGFKGNEEEHLHDRQSRGWLWAKGVGDPTPNLASIGASYFRGTWNDSLQTHTVGWLWAGEGKTAIPPAPPAVGKRAIVFPQDEISVWLLSAGRPRPIVENVALPYSLLTVPADQDIDELFAGRSTFWIPPAVQANEIPRFAKRWVTRVHEDEELDRGMFIGASGVVIPASAEGQPYIARVQGVPGMGQGTFRGIR